MTKMVRRRFFCPAALALLLLAAGLPTLGADQAGDPASELRRTIDSETVVDDRARFLFGARSWVVHRDLSRFYRAREFEPVWLAGTRLSPQGEELLVFLRQSGRDGLDPRLYRLETIEELIGLGEEFRRWELPVEPRYLAHLDLLLSNAFLQLASHLTAGRVDPEAIHGGEWRSRPRKADVEQILLFSLERKRVQEALAGMVPPYPGYLKLREMLEKYRRLAAIGGWPVIAEGPLLRPGGEDSRVPLLRLRLLLAEDLTAIPDGHDLHFDAPTAAALARFQQRHGLQADGVLGPDTLAELNVPVERRIRQLELNLERWRWLPKDLGARYLLVNIADFRLQVVEQGRTVMSMPVVVGTEYRKTPVFTGWLSYLEFAPYWHVPKTILKEDKLPRIRANPAYVATNHYEIVSWSDPSRALDPHAIDWREVTEENFPGVLRMKPGPWNPLGRVKFMFPNEFDVYLHDSPERELFGRESRTFSSGCIRLERPMDLAQYLLERQAGWDCLRIGAAMAATRPQQAKLARPLPVHLLYWTAWIDEEGKAQFRKDIYLRDVELDLALKRNLPEEAGEGGELQASGPVLRSGPSAI